MREHWRCTSASRCWTLSTTQMTSQFHHHRLMVSIFGVGRGREWVKQGEGRGGSGHGEDSRGLCCDILSSLPGQAAQHGPPWLHGYTIAGIEPRRFIDTAEALLEVREHTCPYPEDTTGSVPEPLWSDNCHFCTIGAIGAGQFGSVLSITPDW